MFFYRCRCLKPIPPSLDIKTLDYRRVQTIEKNWAYSEGKNPSKAVDKKSELFNNLFLNQILDFDLQKNKESNKI